MAEWFVDSDGKTYGPFSAGQLKELATSEKINSETRVRRGVDGKWTRGKNVKGLFTQTEVSDAAPVVRIVEPHHQRAEKRNYVVEALATIGATIALAVLFLNVFGGLVSGIWLAIMGEWRIIVGGICAGMVMPTAFAIASLPALGLGLLLSLTGNPPPRWAMATIGFLCALWSALIVAAWTLLIFITFMRLAQPGLTIPMLVWSYATIMSPLAYMAKSDPERSATDIALIVTVITFVVLTILFLAGAQRETMYVSVGVLALIQATLCAFLGVANTPPRT